MAVPFAVVDSFFADAAVHRRVTVTGSEEEQRTNRKVVEGLIQDGLARIDGPVLRLPEMGEVSLHGVLRSELEGVITKHLATYFRDANVRATSTILITVTGSVANPGFHMVEARRLVTDVLAEAGGLSGNANLKGIRIERGEDRIWSGDALQDAIIEGRTLDELSLRAGDHVFVPSETERSGLATWALRIATPGFLLLLIQQAF